MVITNIYADKQYEKKSYKEIHKVSAYTAVASYTLAMVTIIFDF
jgi:Ni/Fe-hydrogenase subunit HybB-like protein